ncbi:MAG TPA: CerR family C-terminal domain-containing protein [Candidatus Acidoferrales bacterium]|nr:CerR family C-terminal domain-containing protein [Candidatus Acidoferrales bacterium]
MRAGANVAAVNYHFGDKLGLYTEVLKQSVRSANIQGIRTALGQNATPEKILRDVIRARLRGVTRGEFPDWQFQIMTHEFAQPTPALAHVLNEVARPIYGRLLDVIGRIVHLPPNHEITRLCAHSVLGQVLHYVLASPLLMRMWPELEMTPQQVDRIADHIADFSLAYLREIGSRRKCVSMAKSARRSK